MTQYKKVSQSVTNMTPLGKKSFKRKTWFPTKLCKNCEKYEPHRHEYKTPFKKYRIIIPPDLHTVSMLIVISGTIPHRENEGPR